MFLAAILIACVFLNGNLSSELSIAPVKDDINCKIVVVCNDSYKLELSVPLKGSSPIEFSIPPMECKIVNKELICLGAYSSKYGNEERRKEHEKVEDAVHDKNLLRQDRDVEPPGKLVPDPQAQKENVKVGGVLNVTQQMEDNEVEIERNKPAPIKMKSIKKYVAATMRYIVIVLLAILFLYVNIIFIVSA